MSERAGDRGRRHVTVAWRIPDDYGGMTGAMLRRSRGLAARGADVVVVTFDDRPDYDEVRRGLGADGVLGDATLRNIYEDFRLRGRPAGLALAPDAAATPPDEVVTTAAGQVRRWREQGGLRRVEHRRADGTLAVVEEALGSVTGARRVTSLDRDGRVTGQWPTLRAFRFAWLDEVIGPDPAVVTVDSKTAAQVMQHYSRPGVALVLMIHGNHLTARGEVAPSRGDVFAHLARWDAVVVLTDRQRAAIEERFGAGDRLAVVHNAVAVPASLPVLPADRMRGVVVSRLTPHKRIDDILRTVADVRTRGVPVTLEVIGDGPARAKLEALARELDLEGAVTFAGFVPGGAARFAGGGWSMLASRSEGESLVLAEAMGAGCVPVAYDIDYGPAEAIRDGRSGFLVPDGDRAAAADSLARLCHLPDAEYAAMREAARAFALTRTDDALLDAWAGIHDRAQAVRAARRASAPPSLVRRVLRRVASRMPPAWRR